MIQTSSIPVGFFSRSLTGSERNYVAYELEMYAVVRAVEHFRVFLLGKEFLLRTDHAALRNLFKRDLPPTTRVERWILRLSEYTFRIEHQKGQDNVIADVLSRLPFASGQESGIAIAKSDQTSATSTSANVKSDSVSLLVPDLDDSSSDGNLDTDSEVNLDSDDESRLSSAIRFLQPHRSSIFRFREKASSLRTSRSLHVKNLRRNRTPTPNSSNFVAGWRQSSVPQQMSLQL